MLLQLIRPCFLINKVIDTNIEVLILSRQLLSGNTRLLSYLLKENKRLRWLEGPLHFRSPLYRKLSFQADV